MYSHSFGTMGPFPRWSCLMGRIITSYTIVAWQLVERFENDKVFRIFCSSAVFGRGLHLDCSPHMPSHPWGPFHIALTKCGGALDGCLRCMGG